MTRPEAKRNASGRSLASRAAVTLVALALYWIGTRVVLPGVAVEALSGIPGSAAPSSLLSTEPRQGQPPGGCCEIA